MEPLSYEGFKALALRSQRAFHLEQRDAYNVAAEDEPFGHLAEDIKLQEEDYWLLDDDTLILSVFSPDGRTGSFAASRARTCSGSAWPSATRCGTGPFHTSSTSLKALWDQP